jgi:hypothetical protein
VSILAAAIVSMALYKYLYCCCHCCLHCCAH